MTEAPQHDVVVIGGGPAGLAAAVTASASARVLLVDDNPSLGGQIWRGEERKPTLPEARLWHDKLSHSGVEVLRGARVFDAPEPGLLLAESAAGALHALRYRKLILATGARERFLPFPGWTLPNVMGAGGLQAMVKSGMPIDGKRVIVAGTGPLLLAVAAYLRAHGAKIEAVAEQATLSRLARFSFSLLRMPGKIGQAISLRRQLSGVPFRTGCWPIAAHGVDKLERVTLRGGSSTMDLPCDYLACGFHLIPNVELPSLLGCRLQNGCVAVDDLQQTSVPDIYCAGEPTGIGGVELSIAEGQIAGHAASGQLTECWRLAPAHRRLQRFARAMDRAFQLRAELRDVPAETLLCRCEDVTLDRVRRHHSWREAKLHTRCGMGPCQGRICGGAASFLFDWETTSERPPVFPAAVAHFAASAEALCRDAACRVSSNSESRSSL